MAPNIVKIFKQSSIELPTDKVLEIARLWVVLCSHYNHNQVQYCMHQSYSPSLFRRSYTKHLNGPGWTSGYSVFCRKRKMTTDFKLILRPSRHIIIVKKEPWKSEISHRVSFYVPHIIYIFVAYIMKILIIDQNEYLKKSVGKL